MKYIKPIYINGEKVDKEDFLKEYLEWIEIGNNKYAVVSKDGCMALLNSIKIKSQKMEIIKEPYCNKIGGKETYSAVVKVTLLIEDEEKNLIEYECYGCEDKSSGQAAGSPTRNLIKAAITNALKTLALRITGWDAINTHTPKYIQWAKDNTAKKQAAIKGTSSQSTSQQPQMPVNNFTKHTTEEERLLISKFLTEKGIPKVGDFLKQFSMDVSTVDRKDIDYIMKHISDSLAKGNNNNQEQIQNSGDNAPF